MMTDEIGNSDSVWGCVLLEVCVIDLDTMKETVDVRTDRE